MSNGAGRRESTFASYHPVVGFVYFCLVIGVTMVSMSPLFLLLTFTAAFGYSLALNGRKALRFNLAVFLPIVVLMAVVNPLFNHRGVTVLYYLNGNPMTREAIVYGLAAAVLMTSVILWFSCANKIITPDKFLYLFGRVLPTLALLLSMCFRFVPLLKARFREISMGQQCMGRGAGTGFFGRIRTAGKELSILIAWSLEAAIETSDSMEARGYGLRGRTSFSLFRFDRRDARLTVLLGLLAAAVAPAIVEGANTIAYYPAIVIQPLTALGWGSTAAYALLLVLPLLIDGKGVLQWRRWRSQM